MIWAAFEQSGDGATPGMGISTLIGVGNLDPLGAVFPPPAGGSLGPLNETLQVPAIGDPTDRPAVIARSNATVLDAVGHTVQFRQSEGAETLSGDEIPVDSAHSNASDETLTAEHYILGVSSSGPPPAGPTAAFSGTPVSGSDPLEVTFTDESTGSPTSWLWEKSDDLGVTWTPFTDSTDQNPTETFTDGSWTVRLTATNDDGSNSTIQYDYIFVGDAVIADFSGTPLSGEAPLTTTFTDLSTGSAIATWFWEKNDGSGWVPFDGTPNDQNPDEDFDPGTWDVRLTVTNPIGSDTETKAAYVAAIVLGDRLVVGGGGAGGGGNAGTVGCGGGGGGGVVHDAAWTPATGTFPIVIGSGGAPTLNRGGDNGDATTFDGLDSGASGGGVGQNGSLVGTIDGASCGGINNGSAAPDTVPSGETKGHKGGTGPAADNWAAGGGGGAGARGANASGGPSGGRDGGNGGAGYTHTLKGAPETVGGGGGGGIWSDGVGGASVGAGGSGGGGNAGALPAGTGSNGTNGLGGGGGGGTTSNSSAGQGGVGGSGKAIASFPTKYFVHTGGDNTGTNGNRTWVEFLASANLVLAYKSPIAKFIGDTITGASPLSVDFTDQSLNNPTSWHWEKNDGSGWVDFDGTPTAQNPTEIFASGNWDVRLTATNATGSNTKTRRQYIESDTPWIEQESSTAAAWQDVVYNVDEDTWVAVGSGANFMVSADGETWADSTAPAGGDWTSIAYGDPGVPITAAISSRADPNNTVSSTALPTWTQDDLGQAGLLSIAYGEDTTNFAAVGPGFAQHTDASVIGWNGSIGSVPGNWRSVTWGENLFVAVAHPSGADPQAMKSSDGITWEPQTMAGLGKLWSRVVYGNGLFVALSSTPGDTSAIATSPDAVVWTLRPTPLPTSGVWTALGFGDGQFIALANGATGVEVSMSSEDGIEWRIEEVPAAYTNKAWSAIHYSDVQDKFVAVAQSGGTEQVMTRLRGS